MLNILFGLMMLLTLLSLLQPILYHFGIKIGTGQDIRVGLSPIAVNEPPGVYESSHGYSLINIEGVLRVEDPTFWISVISFIIPIMMWSSFSYGVFLLRRIIKNVFNGNHFAEVNVRYTRIIALLVILVPHVITIMRNTLFSALPQKLIINGMEIYRMIYAPVQIFNFVIMPGIILTGLIVLVLAEIFKEGGAIKQENDLTV